MVNDLFSYQSTTLHQVPRGSISLHFHHTSPHLLLDISTRHSATFRPDVSATSNKPGIPLYNATTADGGIALPIIVTITHHGSKQHHHIGDDQSSGAVNMSTKKTESVAMTVDDDDRDNRGVGNDDGIKKKLPIRNKASRVTTAIATIRNQGTFLCPQRCRDSDGANQLRLIRPRSAILRRRRRCRRRQQCENGGIK